MAAETGPLLTHFVKSSKLTPDQIQELRDLLEEKDSKK
jgi:predicted transcriptional regulator